MAEDAHASEEWTDCTMSVPEVFRLLGKYLPAFVLLTLGVHLLIWGWPAWTAGQWLTGALWGCLYYLVSVIAHELLHVIVMLIFGVKIGEIRAGVRWKDGIAFVHAGRPLTASAYRLILATPGVVLGVLPVAIGFATGNAAWTIYGFVMLISAIGDIAVYQILRPFSGDTEVEDHPSAVGFRVRKVAA